jgi:hypothetical protein
MGSLKYLGGLRNYLKSVSGTVTSSAPFFRGFLDYFGGGLGSLKSPGGVNYLSGERATPGHVLRFVLQRVGYFEIVWAYSRADLVVLKCRCVGSSLNSPDSETTQPLNLGLVRPNGTGILSGRIRMYSSSPNSSSISSMESRFLVDGDISPIAWWVFICSSTSSSKYGRIWTEGPGFRA